MTIETTSTVVPIRRQQGRIVLGLIEASLDAAQTVPFDDTGAPPGFKVTAETREDLERIIPMLQEANRVLALAGKRETPRADDYYREHEARKVKQ